VQSVIEYSKSPKQQSAALQEGDFDSLGKPMLLLSVHNLRQVTAIGEQFTLLGALNQTGLIHFKASGGNSATPVQGSAGTIKLAWK
jgi:hypothetical protein